MASKLLTVVGPRMITILTVLFMAGSAQAASQSGSAPDQTQAPLGKWTSLDPGQSAWYAFQYSGDTSQVQAWLELAPGSEAAFSVWTPEEIQALGQDGDMPVGRGSDSSEDNGPGQVSWSGNFSEAGTYYVQVENDASSESYYDLHVTGDGVTIPSTQASNETSNAAPATQPAPAMQTQPASQSGATPDQAMSPKGAWTSLMPGQTVWYAFSYAGDSSQAQAWMELASDSQAVFSVWTPEEIEQLGQDGIEPVGRGSDSSTDNGLGQLSWSGSFIEQGTYYVQVQNDTQRVSYYAMHVTGDGVNIP